MLKSTPYKTVLLYSIPVLAVINQQNSHIAIYRKNVYRGQFHHSGFFNLKSINAQQESHINIRHFFFTFVLHHVYNTEKKNPESFISHRLNKIKAQLEKKLDENIHILITTAPKVKKSHLYLHLRERK